MLNSLVRQDLLGKLVLPDHQVPTPSLALQDHRGRPGLQELGLLDQPETLGRKGQQAKQGRLDLMQTSPGQLDHKDKPALQGLVLQVLLVILALKDLQDQLVHQAQTLNLLAQRARLDKLARQVREPLGLRVILANRVRPVLLAHLDLTLSLLDLPGHRDQVDLLAHLDLTPTLLDQLVLLEQQVIQDHKESRAQLAILETRELLGLLDLMQTSPDQRDHLDQLGRAGLDLLAQQVQEASPAQQE